jgi:hypothetical protein
VEGGDHGGKSWIAYTIILRVVDGAEWANGSCVRGGIEKITDNFDSGRQAGEPGDVTCYIQQGSHEFDPCSVYLSPEGL